jgi:predicted dehydrogenase/threonine dehydrogenase-like Zn-dependent dehydrogenase
MLQALVNKGNIITENVPTPKVSEGCLLIKTVFSCISAGTEMDTVQNSGTPLFKRALQQPDNVKKVLDTAKSQGIAKAYAKVKGELDSGKPIGYSLSGIVVGIGKNVKGFSIGDRVTASGAGLANHAEVVDVPINLVTKMPKNLSFDKASTVTLGAIAMQGVRRVDLRMGEIAVVVGCGILGLLSLQMLKASGIRVVAVDLDENRLKLAADLGAEFTINPLNEDSVLAIHNWSGGHGADAVVFTAATTSSEPLSDSFKMCRKKGKVVLVGVVGMNINRGDMYKNELDFLISTSYGPGRYDRNYEDKGLEYPYAYIRWTENRNFSEYLRMVDNGSISLEPLISSKYEIRDANEAFGSLKNKEKKPLMVLLHYGQPDFDNIKGLTSDSKVEIANTDSKKDGVINFAIVGAGSFASNMHLPNLQKYPKKFNAYAICDRTGSTANNVAKLFGAKIATTEFNDIINDPNIDLVIVTTHHDSHAPYALEALRAGKHVMVEKPMAVKQSELDKIKEFYNNDFSNKPIIFVGFNRRFSKYAKEIKKHTEKRINPLYVRYRMNGGYIPLDSWIHDYGGRIVGEACHLIDLMTYFTESKIVNVHSESLTPVNEKFSEDDNKSIVLKYEDGSVCEIDYFAVGSKSFPKEYMEIHFDEKTIVLNDYKRLEGYGVKIKSHNEKHSQKGQKEEIIELYNSITKRSKQWPIDFWDMVQTTEATFQIMNIEDK